MIDDHCSWYYDLLADYYLPSVFDWPSLDSLDIFSNQFLVFPIYVPTHSVDPPRSWDCPAMNWPHRPLSFSLGHHGQRSLVEFSVVIRLFSLAASYVAD